MTDNLQDIQPPTDELFKRSDVCLFELSDCGTVLYCRNGVGGQLADDFAQAVGSNFFDVVKPFDNAEELRPLLDNFVESDYATQKFTFACRIKNRFVPAKIMLVRLPAHSSGKGGKTTIVDIRKI